MSTALAQAQPRPTAASANAIRPFAASDAGEVADLLVRAFQNSDRPAPGAMVAYLREAYLETPWFDPTIAPRVIARADGRIVGFVGVAAMPVSLDGRPLRAAVISSLAADPREADPTIGPRLLREIIAGPQDAVLSDRSNPSAVPMLRALGGEVVRSYSCDWIRSLRPAALAVETLASRFRAARLLTPFAKPFDAAALVSAQRTDKLRWMTPGRLPEARGIDEHDIGLDEAATLIRRFLDGYALRPLWNDADLAMVLSHAAQKNQLGEFVARAVTARNGTPVGLYLYHLRPGRIAHVLQVMADPRREGVVLDRLIADATDRGAVAIRGRATPHLIDPLMDRRCVFLSDLSTVVIAREKSILEAFRQGTAFFTGLAGENWMRLNDNRF